MNGDPILLDSFPLGICTREGEWEWEREEGASAPLKHPRFVIVTGEDQDGLPF